MLALIIIPILVAGFLACHIHPYHSFKLHRYEGQYLYLKSAELGLACFGIAIILSVSFKSTVLSGVNLFGLQINIFSFLTQSLQEFEIGNKADIVKTAWFLIISVLTFIAAFILKIWGYLGLMFRYRVNPFKTAIFVMGKLLQDSPLDNLLFNLSLHRNKYAMLTLSNRKVYVGKIISMGEPTETNGIDQDISIMPLMSGYRDTDTLRVKFTTDYSDTDIDIYLSLRQDSIVSATEFNFDAYNTWKQKTEVKEVKGG